MDYQRHANFIRSIILERALLDRNVLLYQVRDQLEFIAKYGKPECLEEEALQLLCIRRSNGEIIDVMDKFITQLPRILD